MSNTAAGISRDIGRKGKSLFKIIISLIRSDIQKIDRKKWESIFFTWYLASWIIGTAVYGLLNGLVSGMHSLYGMYIVTVIFWGGMGFLFGLFSIAVFEGVFLLFCLVGERAVTMVKSMREILICFFKLLIYPFGIVIKAYKVKNEQQ